MFIWLFIMHTLLVLRRIKQYLHLKLPIRKKTGPRYIHVSKAPIAYQTDALTSTWAPLINNQRDDSRNIYQGYICIYFHLFMEYHFDVLIWWTWQCLRSFSFVSGRMATKELQNSSLFNLFQYFLIIARFCLLICSVFFSLISFFFIM